jgi:hypothetical protein
MVHRVHGSVNRPVRFERDRREPPESARRRERDASAAMGRAQASTLTACRRSGSPWRCPRALTGSCTPMSRRRTTTSVSACAAQRWSCESGANHRESYAARCITPQAVRRPTYKETEISRSSPRLSGSSSDPNRSRNAHEAGRLARPSAERSPSRFILGFELQFKGCYAVPRFWQPSPSLPC